MLAASALARDDHGFLGRETDLPPDEERAVLAQAARRRRGAEGIERRLVREPQLGDAVDRDIERPNPVAAERGGLDLRLGVAGDTRARVRERPVDFPPVLDEVRVRRALLAHQQRDGLDHLTSLWRAAASRPARPAPFPVSAGCAGRAAAACPGTATATR